MCLRIIWHLTLQITIVWHHRGEWGGRLLFHLLVLEEPYCESVECRTSAAAVEITHQLISELSHSPAA